MANPAQEQKQKPTSPLAERFHVATRSQQGQEGLDLFADANICFDQAAHDTIMQWLEGVEMAAPLDPDFDSCPSVTLTDKSTWYDDERMMQASLMPSRNVSWERDENPGKFILPKLQKNQLAWKAGQRASSSLWLYPYEINDLDRMPR